MDSVKRLQIMIERDLDELLGIQARAEGCSKAALVRRYVRERLHLPSGDDPLRGMAGAYEGQPADDIDEVVYGGHYRDRP
jgi:hypothetical protein